MIRIYAGKLPTIQQDVLVLLELEEKTGTWSLTNKFYKIVKVSHIWHGKFAIDAIEGTHIFGGDFNVHTFEPREFYKAQAHLAQTLRDRASGLMSNAIDIFREADAVMVLEPGDERI